MASWTSFPQWTTGQYTSVSRFNQVLDNIEVFAGHSHTGSTGDGATMSSSQIANTRSITFPLISPASMSGSKFTLTTSNDKFGGYISSTCVDDSLTYLTRLNVGTYKAVLYHRLGGACIQITIDRGGTSTLDFPATGAVASTIITAIVISTSGLHQIKFLNLGSSTADKSMGLNSLYMFQTA